MWEIVHPGFFYRYNEDCNLYVDAYFSLRFTAGGAGDCAPVAHGGWVCFVEGVQDVLKLQLRFRVASFTSFRPIGDVGQRSHLL